MCKGSDFRRALRAESVEDDFGVRDGVVVRDFEAVDEIDGDRGGDKAFDGAAVFADEVWVLVLRFLLDGTAEGVAPFAILSEDAVDQFLFDEGVERAVDGDGVGMVGHVAEDFGDADGFGAAGEAFEDADADGSSAEGGGAECGVDGVVFHGWIIGGKRGG